MYKERLIVENPVVVGDFTLTVISRMVIRWPRIREMASCYASKQPVYLLVSSALEERAYDPAGKEVPVADVKSELSRCDFNQIVS